MVIEGARQILNRFRKRQTITGVQGGRELVIVKGESLHAQVSQALERFDTLVRQGNTDTQEKAARPGVKRQYERDLRAARKTAEALLDREIPVEGKHNLPEGIKNIVSTAQRKLHDSFGPITIPDESIDRLDPRIAVSKVPETADTFSILYTDRGHKALGEVDVTDRGTVTIRSNGTSGAHARVFRMDVTPANLELAQRAQEGVARLEQLLDNVKDKSRILLEVMEPGAAGRTARRKRRDLRVTADEVRGMIESSKRDAELMRDTFITTIGGNGKRDYTVPGAPRFADPYFALPIPSFLTIDTVKRDSTLTIYATNGRNPFVDEIAVGQAEVVNGHNGSRSRRGQNVERKGELASLDALGHLVTFS